MPKLWLETFVTTFGGAAAGEGFSPDLPWGVPGGGRFRVAGFRRTRLRQFVPVVGVSFTSTDPDGGPALCTVNLALRSVATYPTAEGAVVPSRILVAGEHGSFIEDNLGHGWVVPFMPNDIEPWEVQLRTQSVGASRQVATVDLWWVRRLPTAAECEVGS
jgi:hypothetical protein